MCTHARMKHVHGKRVHVWTSCWKTRVARCLCHVFHGGCIIATSTGKPSLLRVVTYSCLVAVHSVCNAMMLMLVASLEHPLIQTFSIPLLCIKCSCCPDDLWALIQRCWAQDSNNRPTAEVRPSTNLYMLPRQLTHA